MFRFCLLYMLSVVTDISFCEYTLIFLRSAHFIFFFEIKPHLLFFIIKMYIIVLMFRYVATPQELHFNPIGKTVAILTNPIFKKFQVTKDQSDRFVPILILSCMIIAFLIKLLFVGNNIFLVFFSWFLLVYF